MMNNEKHVMIDFISDFFLLCVCIVCRKQFQLYCKYTTFMSVYWFLKKIGTYASNFQ